MLEEFEQIAGGKSNKKKKIRKNITKRNKSQEAMEKH